MIENPYQQAITNVNIKDDNKIEQVIIVQSSVTRSGM